MTPIKFEEAKHRFGPPSDLQDSQCLTIYAYAGMIERGSVEGSPVIVTAWQPSDEEKLLIAQGKPIYLSFLCTGLPPHYLSMSFKEATNPA